MTDREIDLKIARALFGYVHLKFTRVDGTSFVHFMDSTSAAQPSIAARNPESVESGDEENCPRYSGDIALAFLVAEKMCGSPERSGGQRMELNVYFPVNKEDFWSCELICRDRKGHALADTAPRAICLAAIAAIEQERK